MTQLREPLQFGLAARRTADTARASLPQRHEGRHELSLARSRAESVAERRCEREHKCSQIMSRSHLSKISLPIKLHLGR